MNEFDESLEDWMLQEMKDMFYKEMNQELRNSFNEEMNKEMKRKLQVPSKLGTESAQADEQDLIEIKKENALQAFETGEGVDEIIERARQTVREFKHDMSTVAGRKRSASLAYKVSRLKVQLDGMRKELVSEKKALVAKVDRNGKHLRDSLDEVRDEARKPLDEWERAEEARITRHQENLLAIKALAPSGQEDGPKMSLLYFEGNLDHVRNTDIDDSWEEFKEQALEARHKVTLELEQCIENEKNRLELERMRKEKEEREQKEADERAEQERIENEKRRALEEKKRIEAAKKEAAELAAKLEREKQLAKFREEKEIAEQKRKDEIAKAEEALRRKQQETEAANKKAKEAKEEAERANFERMKAEAAAKAEAELAARQAVLDEQRRVAEQKAKEEVTRKIEEEKWRKKRERKDHVLRIDKEAFDALLDIIDHPFDNPIQLTDSILVAIKEGNVKHVTINY